jgi:AmmeMemoRadiSam system protein B
MKLSKIVFLPSAVVLFIVSLYVGWYLYTPIFRVSHYQSVLSTNVEKKISTHSSYSLDHNFFKAFYDSVTSTEVINTPIVSAVVPHHLIAGNYLAAFFHTLRNQHPPVVVILGPNHPQRGNYPVITSAWNWQTPDGEIKVNQPLVKALSDRGLATFDEKIIAIEHTIGAVIPFVKHTWPNAELVPLILKENTATTTIQYLADSLKELLPPGSVVLASVDFSHYLPSAVADFHDELSENILATANRERVSKIEADSPKSLALLLAYNHLQQAERFTLYSHTNSARIIGDPDIAETTSHLIGYFSPGKSDVLPLISLQFFGDIMLDRQVASSMGKRGLDYVFEKIHGLENRFFSGVDFFVANLEGPFAPARIDTTKTIAFRFDPKYAMDLKRYGFTAFSLANNHALDMGVKNVDFTEKILDRVGLGHFGSELHESSEYILVKSVPGTSEKVAFVGFNTTDHSFNFVQASSTLALAKEQANNIIIFMHWGVEYQHHSNAAQQELAHWLVDHGATAVIGAHPHVVEEMEMYQGHPIFYSLGNFVFDQYFSKETQEGLSVGLSIQNGQVKNISLFPLQSSKSQPSLMAGDRRKIFLEWFKKIAK